MLFLTFLISVSIASQDLLKKCYLEQFTIGDPEVKIQIYFEDHIVKNHQIEYECLEFIISRGYYKVALSLYENYFLLNHIDITDRIVQFLKNDKYLNQREMQTLFKLAMAKSNQVQIVQPVVQWAQSKNATFINIKFSHRQDAPACLNAKLEVVEIKNDSLLIEAFGIVSHIPFKYRYAIKLYKPIDPATSYEKVESVGTMYVNLTKIEPVLWLRLTEEDYKTPIWWDLKDNFRKDMEEFAQMIEKESERKEKNADKQAKKNQKKRDQEKQKQTSQKAQEAKRQLQCLHNENTFIWDIYNEKLILIRNRLKYYIHKYFYYFITTQLKLIPREVTIILNHKIAFFNKLVQQLIYKNQYCQNPFCMNYRI